MLAQALQPAQIHMSIGMKPNPWQRQFLLYSP
jgi:hypothetical protein